MCCADWKEALLLFAVSEGYAKDADPADMDGFGDRLTERMEALYPDTVKRLMNGARLSEEEKDGLRRILDEICEKSGADGSGEAA